MSTLPSAGRMYRALAERDTEFEGVFFTGVRTTRIFCRPGCTARLPAARELRVLRDRDRGPLRRVPAVPPVPPPGRRPAAAARRRGPDAAHRGRPCPPHHRPRPRGAQDRPVDGAPQLQEALRDDLPRIPARAPHEPRVRRPPRGQARVRSGARPRVLVQRLRRGVREDVRRAALGRRFGGLPPRVADPDATRADGRHRRRRRASSSSSSTTVAPWRARSSGSSAGSPRRSSRGPTPSSVRSRARSASTSRAGALRSRRRSASKARPSRRPSGTVCSPSPRARPARTPSSPSWRAAPARRARWAARTARTASGSSSRAIA